MQKRTIAAFLDGPATCLGLWGPVGSGKLFLVEQVVRAKGLQHQVLDKAQGAIPYARLGGACLSSDGSLAAAAYVIVNAHESDWSFTKTLRGKFVFISNAELALRGLKAAKFECVKVPRPTVDSMTKTLFLEHEWPVEKAQRLAVLAEGDWRKLTNLDRLFTDARVDVASAADEEFQQIVQDTAKDKRLLAEAPPSAAVHALFSGHAAQSGTVEAYADHSVLMWGERNLGITSGTLEDMQACQEAAVIADVLERQGAPEEGLEHFARTAAARANNGLRYDFKAYASPWQDVRGVEVAAIRASFDSRRPRAWHEMRRLSKAQGTDEPTATTPKGRTRGAAAATKAPKRKAAKK